MSGTRAISTTSRRELSSNYVSFLQGKAPKEIHDILTETLARFFPGRAKDLSAPLYYIIHFNNIETRAVIKFFFCKARRRRKFTTFWQKHQLVSFLVGLRTYQHPCTISYILTTSRHELSSSFFFCKARRRRKFTTFWQKHQLVSFLVGLRTYRHPCIRILHCRHCRQDAVLLKLQNLRLWRHVTSRHVTSRHVTSRPADTTTLHFQPD